MKRHLAFVLLVVGLAGAAACSSGSSGPSSGYVVAVMDDPSIFVETDPAVIEANSLLDVIAPRCAMSPQEVADMAVLTRNILRDTYGIVVKVLDVLQGVNSATSGLTDVGPCADVFAAWVVSTAN